LSRSDWPEFELLVNDSHNPGQLFDVFAEQWQEYCHRRPFLVGSSGCKWNPSAANQYLVEQILWQLQYSTSSAGPRPEASTSTIERRDATACLMNSMQKRETLTFPRHSATKLALCWWALTIYNWCRPYRMLRSRVKQYYGQSRYVDRTPAMAVDVAREVFTEEMVLRVQVFQFCSCQTGPYFRHHRR
jgi:hypothetical protein